jgi:hypothetical protein
VNRGRTDLGSIKDQVVVVVGISERNKISTDPSLRSRIGDRRI